MARLSENGSWLIQQIDGMVVLFNEHDGEEIVKFDPSSANDSATSQKIIHDSDKLTDEEKCFAHFWSGYFYAHSGGV